MNSKIHLGLRYLGLGFIGLIFVAAIFGLIKKNIYNDKVGINILMVSSKGIGIVGVRNGSGYLNILDLPDDLKIPVLPSRSEFSVETLRKSGIKDKNKEQIMKQSIGEAFGVAITGTIFTNKEISISGILDSLTSLGLESNLSLIDRFRLRSDLTNLVKKGTSFELSLPKAVTDEDEEPDGKVFRKLNTAIFSWSKNQWGQDEIMSETPEIAIVNGSKTQGRARTVAHQVETAGGRVIEVSASESQINGCLISGDKVKHPITYSFLLLAFGCQEDIRGSINKERSAGADIVMVIGDS